MSGSVLLNEQWEHNMDWDDETKETFKRAMKLKLDTLKMHPHQVLGIPPMIHGKDVECHDLSAEATLAEFKKLWVS